MNDLYADTTLSKGTPVKIGLAEPYIPTPQEENPDEEKNEGEANKEPEPQDP